MTRMVRGTHGKEIHADAAHAMDPGLAREYERTVARILSGGRDVPKQATPDPSWYADARQRGEAHRIAKAKARRERRKTQHQQRSEE